MLRLFTDVNKNDRKLYSLFCSTVPTPPAIFRSKFVRRNIIYLQIFIVANPRKIRSANKKSANQKSANQKSANRKNTWGLLIINPKIATFAKAPPI
jgi:hypothetical protein